MQLESDLIFGATSATNGRETFVVSCVNFFKTTQKSYFCAKYAINMQNLHDLYAAVTQNVVFTLFCRKFTMSRFTRFLRNILASDTTGRVNFLTNIMSGWDSETERDGSISTNCFVDLILIFSLECVQTLAAVAKPQYTKFGDHQSTPGRTLFLT